MSTLFPEVIDGDPQAAATTDHLSRRHTEWLIIALARMYSLNARRRYLKLGALESTVWTGLNV